jgi:hypothetical protein
LDQRNNADINLKRKQSEASQDLFASDNEDNDDEIASFCEVRASREKECYSPVAPFYMPTTAPYFFEDSTSSNVLPFDTSKLDSQSSELSTSYRMVISTDLDRIEDQIQLKYYDEFLEVTAEMDERDALDQLALCYEQAAVDIGLSVLKTRQAMSLFRSSQSKRPRLSPSTSSDSISSNAGFSPEFMSRAYRDYRMMAQEAENCFWLSEGEAYLTGDDIEFESLQRLMLAAGSRRNVPSQRIAEVLSIYRDATPSERFNTWRIFNNLHMDSSADYNGHSIDVDQTELL